MPRRRKHKSGRDRRRVKGRHKVSSSSSSSEVPRTRRRSKDSDDERPKRSKVDTDSVERKKVSDVEKHLRSRKDDVDRGRLGKETHQDDKKSDRNLGERTKNNKVDCADDGDEGEDDDGSDETDVSVQSDAGAPAPEVSYALTKGGYAPAAAPKNKPAKPTVFESTLGAVALPGGTGGATSASNNAGLDVVDSYEVFRVPGSVFLRMETKRGLVGWGEPHLEGWDDAVIAAVRTMMPSVVGQQALGAQGIWNTLNAKIRHIRGPVLMSALAGIDQALWDIKGKALELPVHQLLGGAVRERLKVSHYCCDNDEASEAAVVQARHAVERGYLQLTLRIRSPTTAQPDQAVQRVVDRVGAVRTAVGSSVALCVDFQGEVPETTSRALMKALEQHGPVCYEEPLPIDEHEVLSSVASSTCIPVSAGRWACSLLKFQELLQRRSVGLLQPDARVGGLSQMLTIARLAGNRGVGFAPRCPSGPMSLAACLQVDACAESFAFQETIMGASREEAGASGAANSDPPAELFDYVTNMEDLAIDADGCVPLLWRPGLGIVIDEGRVREAAKNFS